MDTQSSNVSFDKITTSAVFDHLKSRKYVDNIYKNILEQIKKTPSYKRMKEVAVAHIAGILFDASKRIPGPEDRMEKKKEIAEIGILALTIDSSISTIVSETLCQDAPPLINNTIKELLRNELKRSSDAERDSPRKKGRNFPDINQRKFKEYRNANQDSDQESTASEGNFSFESVSSVHTSDLSSFEDIIVVSEEEEGLINKKKFSLEIADRYIRNNLAAIRKKVQPSASRTKNKKRIKVPKFKPSLSSKKPDVSASTDICQRARSKRMRKPNSKYSSDEILVTDSIINPRYNEHLEVQSDLKLINEGRFSQKKL